MTAKLLDPTMAGQRQKFLLYGEPGTGKTRAAGTAPGPIYFLSVGGPGEYQTFFSPSFQAEFPDKKIYTDVAEESISERGQFGDAVGFDQACDLLDAHLQAEEAGETEVCATVVIDNATILSEYQMNKVLEIGGQEKPGDKTAYKKLRDQGIRLPHDTDWGGAQSLMQQFVSWLFRLDKHVVLVAHEHQDTSMDRAARLATIEAVKPLFIGKQRRIIANMFDNVWRFSRNGQFYEARTEGQSKPFPIVAKTRIGGVLDKDYRDVDLEHAIKQLVEAAHGE